MKAVFRRIRLCPVNGREGSEKGGVGSESHASGRLDGIENILQGFFFF